MIVLFFAEARRIAGASSGAIDVPTHCTVGALRRALAVQIPNLEPLLPRCRIAVDREFADDASAIPDNAEVALIPPVSGG